MFHHEHFQNKCLKARPLGGVWANYFFQHVRVAYLHHILITPLSFSLSHSCSLCSDNGAKQATPEKTMNKNE